ncbi:Transmembrane protein 147 [Merluccius polli]|uniref:BOS complex subunit TMEM147 n=1 Tax=Merluccius polli TaxID=89951 RepID=A0AA47P3K2_MERPO|nr:Transmembrane protein 147 [Merluccius polli]
MTTVYPSSDGYFQQDNAPCHKARIISDWFLEHDNEFTVLKWPPQSPDLNPIEHLWDVVEREIRIMDVQPTNLQQLRDAIMSIWTKLSEECFQYLVESVPRRIKAVLKAKGGPTRCLPLWVGARGIEFDWKYIQMSFDSNISLVHYIAMASVVWMFTRYDLPKSFRLPVTVLLGLCVYKAFLMELFVHMFLLGSWTALLVKAILTGVVSLCSLLLFVTLVHYN